MGSRTVHDCDWCGAEKASISDMALLVSVRKLHDNPPFPPHQYICSSCAAALRAVMEGKFKR